MKKIIMTAIILTLYSSSLSFAQESPTKEPTGKIYSVNTADNQIIFANIEPTDFHGLKCLKGKAAIGWQKDLPAVYVSLDKVVSIYEYDSLEMYQTVVEKFNKKKME